jgi:predicted nucleic acid-binding protein
LKVALDTNVLVYAEGVNGRDRQSAALALLAQVDREQVLLPVQVLEELFHVLSRKSGRSPDVARQVVKAWKDSCETHDTTAETLGRGLDLAVEHGMSTWDAIILAAASEAGCRVLLSEDMKDGFVWGGVTVVNPFATRPSPLLAAILAPRR